MTIEDRRFTMTIVLGADSEQDMQHALGLLLSQWRLGNLRGQFSEEGPGAEWIGETVERPPS